MIVWNLHLTPVKMNVTYASVRVILISASRNAKPSETIAARIHMVSPDIYLCKNLIILVIVAFADKLCCSLSIYIFTPQDGATIRT